MNDPRRLAESQRWREERYDPRMPRLEEPMGERAGHQPSRGQPIDWNQVDRMFGDDPGPVHDRHHYRQSSNESNRPPPSPVPSNNPFRSNNPFLSPQSASSYSPMGLASPTMSTSQMDLASLEEQELQLQLRLIQIQKQRLQVTRPDSRQAVYHPVPMSRTLASDESMLPSWQERPVAESPQFSSAEFLPRRPSQRQVRFDPRAYLSVDEYGRPLQVGLARMDSVSRPYMPGPQNLPQNVEYYQNFSSPITTTPSGQFLPPNQPHGDYYQQGPSYWPNAESHQHQHQTQSRVPSGSGAVGGSLHDSSRSLERVETASTGQVHSAGMPSTPEIPTTQQVPFVQHATTSAVSLDKSPEPTEPRPRSQPENVPRASPAGGEVSVVPVDEDGREEIPPQPTDPALLGLNIKQNDVPQINVDPSALPNTATLSTQTSEISSLPVEAVPGTFPPETVVEDEQKVRPMVPEKRSPPAVPPKYKKPSIASISSSHSTFPNSEQSTRPTTPGDSDIGKPLPIPPKSPAIPDEELAWEIAAEDATHYLNEGRLEELHPMLQEQLAEAMKKHMPDSNSEPAAQSPPVPDAYDDSGQENGKFPEFRPQAQTSENETHVVSPNPVPLDEHWKTREDGRPHRPMSPPVSEVGKSPYSPTATPMSPPYSQRHKGDTASMLFEAGKLGQSARPSTRTGHKKKRDSGLFSGHDTDTGTGLHDEDACECGKARPSVDECYFCWPCEGTIFCKDCWDKCPPHKKRRFGTPRPGGLPHEKSDPAMARKIFETLQSGRNLEQQALMHVKDEDTSWFGTGRDEVTGDVVFQDFGRYSRLMADSSSQHRRVRYPALVSFVGQTGAGKSSLIRLLIEAYAAADAQPQVPVVGSTQHADLPTSGDVHLYADMVTFDGEQPILYADCEGLDGGEREPMGAKSRNKDKKPALSKDRTQSFTKHIRKQHHTSEREILWADTAQKRSREYHVRHLYPRLLYTFSDVIVFVMKNPRVIENTIEQLIKWAAAALETSSNQPVLPHAIIVLNAYDNASDPSLWDVDKSTVDLMEKVSRAVHQNHGMRKFAEFWRERGKNIESVENLLLSYYSNVRVVRVPERGRPTLINEQVKKLYQEITVACDKSRYSKHQVRMLLNSDELQPYLQYAFDHFSRNLDRPFDFVQASLAHNPIPSNFGGNILKLAIDIMDLWKDKLDGPSIFKELSFMVASCIMLDGARHRTLGPAEKVFGAYIHYCDDALEEFCNRHWPCEYVHPNTRGRCVNVRAGHQSKGHQLQSGKVLAVGSYESDFTPERYQEFFQYCVVWNLRDLLNRLQEATQNSPHLELEKASEIHRNVVLNPFFHHLRGPNLEGPKLFISHTACYSCLRNPPEHALPCGHVLCTPCVQAYGTARGRCLIEIGHCPLHHKDPEGQFQTRWPLFVKPPGAGIRVLSLDGGGVRGIIELTIMSQIEKALGPGLPIQAFFDLIVGTSTGGIVALGLGANGLKVKQCSYAFEKLCQKAFTKRKGIGLPGLEHVISFSNHSRYETGPIESALQEAFGAEQHLFAGSRDELEDQAVLQRLTKVAVTTVTTAGTVALLGNYNRVDEEESGHYQFHRSEKPSGEIKTWQAARATSAAPTMFKPFAHDPSGQVYQDGALYYNCPVELAVREQRLIWPDTADSCPDVILSIGTGVNANSRKPLVNRRAPRFGIFGQARALAKIAIDHIQSSLNSEQTWKRFVGDTNPPEHLKDRYIRLNLRMDKDPPRMDEVSQLRDMKEMTVSQFRRREDEVKAVADRLLATCFYFALDQEPSSSGMDEVFSTVTGTIQCRFAPHSSELRSLGEALRRRSRVAYNRNFDQHNPFFVIRERRKEHDARQVVVGPEVVDRMISEGVFSMDKLPIRQTDNRAETEILFCLGDQPQQCVLYPISGFPRYFMEEILKLTRPKLPTTAPAANPHVFNMNWAAYEAKKKSWKFAAADFLRSKDPFKYYSSIDYRNPGDAAPDLLQTLSDRFSDVATTSKSNTSLYYAQSPGLLDPKTAALYGPRTSLEISPPQPVEMSTETELAEDWTSNQPISEDEVLRRQLLRLLLSRGSIVSGPPRLAAHSSPMLHPNLATSTNIKSTQRPVQSEAAEMPGYSTTIWAFEKISPANSRHESLGRTATGSSQGATLPQYGRPSRPRFSFEHTRDDE